MSLQGRGEGNDVIPRIVSLSGEEGVAFTDEVLQQAPGCLESFAQHSLIFGTFANDCTQSTFWKMEGSINGRAVEGSLGKGLRKL